MMMNSFKCMLVALMAMVLAASAANNNNSPRINWDTVHSMGRELRHASTKDRVRVTRDLVDHLGGKDKVQEMIAEIQKIPQAEHVHQDLEALVNQLQTNAMKHPLLSPARFEEMGTEKLAVFARQCYEYIRAFPLMLGGLIANIPAGDVKSLFVLVDNLVDECGGYDKLDTLETDQAHPILFHDFLVKVGVLSNREDDVEAPDETLEGTQKFISLYFDACDSTDFSFSMGSFGPGNECFSKKWVPIVQGLRANKHHKFSDDDLKFFEIHSPAADDECTSVEDEHGNMMLLLLGHAIESGEATYDKVEAGARQAVGARLAFFDNLHSVL